MLRLSNTVADPAWTADTAAGWDVCLRTLAAVLDGRAERTQAGPDEALIARYRQTLAAD
ncbi:SRPBCC family protein [Nocardiopsis dassonvillei]|uniref:hypothetical protein n=1 Tax=Nocardiopsis dassonvillei TaxID=2014 RepID=UPI00366CE57F